jgi:hypothetical protein
MARASGLFTTVMRRISSPDFFSISIPRGMSGGVCESWQTATCTPGSWRRAVGITHPSSVVKFSQFWVVLGQNHQKPRFSAF